MHNYIEITIDLPNTPEKPDSSEPVSIDVAYPIHSWCLFGEWKCKVVGYDGDKVVCMMPQNYAHGRYDGFTAGRIKPYETPEQAAKRKRDEWINKALGHTFSGKVAYEVLCDVYDWLLKTGQLKESENES